MEQIQVRGESPGQSSSAKMPPQEWSRTAEHHQAIRATLLARRSTFPRVELRLLLEGLECSELLLEELDAMAAIVTGRRQAQNRGGGGGRRVADGVRRGGDRIDSSWSLPRALTAGPSRHPAPSGTPCP